MQFVFENTLLRSAGVGIWTTFTAGVKKAIECGSLIIPTSLFKVLPFRRWPGWIIKADDCTRNLAWYRSLLSRMFLAPRKTIVFAAPIRQDADVKTELRLIKLPLQSALPKLISETNPVWNGNWCSAALFPPMMNFDTLSESSCGVRFGWYPQNSGYSVIGLTVDQSMMIFSANPEAQMSKIVHKSFIFSHHKVLLETEICSLNRRLLFQTKITI